MSSNEDQLKELVKAVHELTQTTNCLINFLEPRDTQKNYSSEDFLKLARQYQTKLEIIVERLLS